MFFFSFFFHSASEKEKKIDSYNYTNKVGEGIPLPGHWILIQGPANSLQPLIDKSPPACIFDRSWSKDWFLLSNGQPHTDQLKPKMSKSALVSIASTVWRFAMLCCWPLCNFKCNFRLFIMQHRQWLSPVISVAIVWNWLLICRYLSTGVSEKPVDHLLWSVLCW